MKKFKYLPSVLMLVLCLAVLAVGIYAIKPTQNTIEGTITIGATNPHVVITAYKTAALNEDGTEATANKLVGPLDARAGAKLEIADSLEFDIEKANTKEDVDDLVIVLKIENKSNKDLGAYFYEGLSTDTMPEVASLANVRTYYLFKENDEDADEDAVINTEFTGYSRIAPYVSDEDTSNITYMQITFKLNQFKEYTSDFNFPLNIETYNPAMNNDAAGLMLNVIEEKVADNVAISNDAENATVTSLQYTAIPASGTTIYAGVMNFSYTPATAGQTELASEGESTDALVEKFSFNVEYYTAAIAEAMGEEFVIEEVVDLIALGQGNTTLEELMGGGNPTQYEYETDYVITGNTITIYETETTLATNDFFLLVFAPNAQYYALMKDPIISLSTPSFEGGEKLEMPKYSIKINGSDSMVCEDQTITQQYTMETSEDTNITKKVSVIKSRLVNVPEEAKTIYIHSDVTKGNIYLIDSNVYDSAVAQDVSLSEIMSAMESSSITGCYYSTGEVGEDGEGTTFEITYNYLSDGTLGLTFILLSDTETLEVNYTLEFSEEYSA
ncbi:MAG: hypothetical protein IJW25_01180, partial [Clostridia bacterium]|nr:hypothetical protein [Clostridia bacterium]